MSSTTFALNHTLAENSRTPPITAEAIGLELEIFKPLREAVGFLKNTIRFPDSSIPQEQRPSTKEHTISAMHRAAEFANKTTLDPKTITSILRKIMIHDLDEIIGKEFHAVATHANGTAVKDLKGFGKLTERIALNTILVALLNADPYAKLLALLDTPLQKDFPSLEEFVQGLRDEIKDITDNDLGVTILNNHFEKPEIKAQLSPEWLSPDYRKAFESLKNDYLSMESNPNEQDSFTSLIGKLIEKWDGIITVNSSGLDDKNPVPSYYLEGKTPEERATELSYTSSVMNRMVSIRDTFNILIDRTKGLLKESLSWMSIADGQHYRIEDFPKQLGWMHS
jgi:hypothetical protein